MIKKEKKDNKKYYTTYQSDKYGLVENIYNPVNKESKFASARGGVVKYHDSLIDGENKIMPLKASSDIIKTNLLRLPSGIGEYGEVKQLFSEIKSYINSYVELHSSFVDVVACFVMTTWLFDQFQVVPYLRVIGNFGSGKTRFLDIVGNICYKPIFVGGSTSLASVFRLVDCFKGTLVFDEADFRFTDARSDVTKILNSGHTRGYPVTRTEQSKDGEFIVKSYDVFGPKILASRERFTDQALESRCLSQNMMPLNKLSKPETLPKNFNEEVLKIRNRLLKFRFDHYQVDMKASTLLADLDIPRLKQTGSSLAMIAELIDKKVSKKLRTI